MDIYQCVVACFGITAGCLIVLALLSGMRDFMIPEEVLKQESEDARKIAGYKQATKQKKLELKAAKKSRPYQLKN